MAQYYYYIETHIHKKDRDYSCHISIREKLDYGYKSKMLICKYGFKSRYLARKEGKRLISIEAKKYGHAIDRKKMFND